MRRVSTAAIGGLALVIAMSGAAQAFVVEARPNVRSNQLGVTATHQKTVTHTQPGRSSSAQPSPRASPQAPAAHSGTNAGAEVAPPVVELSPIERKQIQGISDICSTASQVLSGSQLPAECRPSAPAAQTAPAAQAAPGALAAQQDEEPTVTVTEVRESAIDKIDLTAPDLGASPCLADADNCTGTVGVPVWLWVDDGDGELPFETASASAGPYSIEATAEVAQVKWSLGDGQETICEGAGTKFNADTHGWSAPDCGFETGWKNIGTHTLTASYVWDLSWSGDENGSTSRTLSTTQEINVREIQTVVTGHDK